MDSVADIVNIVKEPGEQFKQDLLKISVLLKKFKKDDYEPLIRCLMFLGYCNRADYSALEITQNAVVASIGWDDKTKNEAYSQMQKMIFGGNENAYGNQGTGGVKGDKKQSE